MSLILVLLCVLLSRTVETSKMFRLPVTRIQPDPGELTLREAYRATMFDYYDNFYITTIEVGDKGEEFRVVLDTGSGHFFLPSIFCGENCGEHRKYFCSNPSAYFIQLIYGTGEAVGNVCTASVKIAGLTVRNQQIVMVHNEDKYLREFQFDGILGLAHRMKASFTIPNGAVRYITPVFYNLVNQEKIRKAFSFYMTSLDNAVGSFVYLGGSDDNYYEGVLKHVPVVPRYVVNGVPYYKDWQVKMTSFKFGNLELLNGTENVLIDSGTSDIIVSRDIYNSLMKIIDIHYTCELAEFYPVIRMMFGNHEFILHGPDYMQIQNDNCIYRLAPNGESNIHSFIMGDVFFRKYYIEFDLESNMIGFAPSKNLYSKTKNSKAK